MDIRTNDPLQSPVFASELAAYARLDSDDPIIDTVLLSATQAVINFLKLDLMTRTWVLTHRCWPTAGTATYPHISPNSNGYLTRIELPYTNLVSVDSVSVNGEASTDYKVSEGKPYTLEFDTFSNYDSEQNALVVTYKAGFGEGTADVPQPIRNAIMMAAGYIYAHNGVCDYGDAIAMSGAKQLLVPYAVKAGIVI